MTPRTKKAPTMEVLDESGVTVKTEPFLPPGNGAAFERIPVICIHTSRTNPRKRFDEAALRELADSIRTHGVLQPILVRKRPKTTNVYELVAGERRWRAAKEAGLAEIPAVVRDLSDLEVLEIQLVENLERKDLHPLEEADGYRALHEKYGYTVETIAAKLGRSRKYVYDRIKLLQLTEEAREAFLEERITAGHAILLARLKPADQKRAMDVKERALFEHQQLLDMPYGAAAAEHEKPAEGDRFKARSVRELAGWIDQNIRLDPHEIDDEQLELDFPELDDVLDDAEKLLPITHQHVLRDSARAKVRTFTCRSWKRADGRGGSKTCEHSVHGVVVAGPGRGDTFRVCVARDKCKMHWAAEQREKASGGQKARRDHYERQAERQRQADERDRADKARWDKAAPAIEAAVAAAVSKAPATATGRLADVLVSRLRRYGDSPKAAEKHVPRGATAEDLVRHLAFLVLRHEIHEWRARIEFPKRAKALGLDVKKILDEHAPEEKPPAGAKKKAQAKRRK